MSDDDGLIRLNFVANILYRVFIYSLLNSEIISQFIPYQIAQSDDTIVFFLHILILIIVSLFLIISVNSKGAFQ